MAALILAAETWLSSSEFTQSLRKVYEKNLHGSTGCSDRNISLDLWMDCVQQVHQHLLDAHEIEDLSHEALESLQLLLPEPDEEFVHTAIELLRAGPDSCTALGGGEEDGDGAAAGSGAGGDLLDGLGVDGGEGAGTSMLGGKKVGNKLHSTAGTGGQKSGGGVGGLASGDSFPSLMELQRDGITDYEQFEEMTQAVSYVHAEVLCH